MRSIESPTCFSVQWMDPLTGEAIMPCKCLWKTPLGMEACSCLEKCMFFFTVHNMEKNKDKKIIFMFTPYYYLEMLLLRVNNIYQL